MKKQPLMEYITPTFDLYTAPVESGFAATGFETGGGTIEDGTENDWGTL